MKTKPFYQSRTLWINVIGLIVVVLQYFGTVHWLPDQTLAVLLTVVNLGLRVVTTQPVTMR